MAKTQRPRRINRYSAQFKLTAVRLSNARGVQVKDVADALDIHPFMLSKWRKQAREGAIRPDRPPPRLAAKPVAKPGKAIKPRVKIVRVTNPPSAATRREMQRYAALKREHALLKEEHELLKKAIRFCSARSATSSRSSSRNRTSSPSIGSVVGLASAAPAITRGADAARRITPAKTKR